MGEAMATVHLASLPHRGRLYFIETYGCQMNVSDTEIVASILEGAGYEPAASAEEADTILLNTCAIREGAEAKVWNRLKQLKGLRRQRAKGATPAIGVLGACGVRLGAAPQRLMRRASAGCMAERLKERLMEREQLVDIVAGPDAYRDLPSLLLAVQVRQRWWRGGWARRPV